MTETISIGIAEMTCDHCVSKVKKALRGLNGAKEVNVDRGRALAQVTFDHSVVDVPAMHDVLLRTGINRRWYRSPDGAELIRRHSKLE